MRETLASSVPADLEAPRSPTGWKRHRLAVVLAALALATAAVPAFSGQPQQWLRCAWEARDGWTVEHPRVSLSEAEFRRAVREQTSCVELTIRRVNTNSVPEGSVVRPVGTRSWISATSSLEVLVESHPGAGVVECGEAIRADKPGVATEVLACPSTTDSPPDLSTPPDD